MKCFWACDGSGGAHFNGNFRVSSDSFSCLQVEASAFPALRGVCDPGHSYFMCFLGGLRLQAPMKPGIPKL